MFPDVIEDAFRRYGYCSVKHCAGRERLALVVKNDQKRTQTLLDILISHNLGSFYWKAWSKVQGHFRYNSLFQQFYRVLCHLYLRVIGVLPEVLLHRGVDQSANQGQAAGQRQPRAQYVKEKGLVHALIIERSGSCRQFRVSTIYL